MASWWTQYILQNAKRHGVADPYAALAVANSEGLSGGVGDNGTSFGPFQLHVGGALPRGRGRAWAESQAGLDYALQQIGKIDDDLTGDAAIANIVKRFERPADAGGEISRSVATYRAYRGGKVVDMGRSPIKPTNSKNDFADTGQRAALVSYLMDTAQQFASGRPDYTEQTRNLVNLFAAQREALAASPALATRKTANGPVPVSSIEGAMGGKPWQRMVAAIRQAQNMGLSVRENPLVDPVEHVHVANSNHYSVFPGNKKVGRAADISGNPAKMAAFTKWYLKNYGGGRELFYDPLGGWKNGRSIGAIGGHRDHVHIAL